MKVIIAGLGRIGREHVDAYRSADAEIVAAVEPATDVAERFSADYDIEVYSNLTSFLEARSTPDIMSICTPPSSHRELVEVAVPLGINVLCEKPMAHTLEDALAIHQIASSSGVLFSTAYCHRFQPELEEMKTLIEDGRIGTPRAFYNQFARQQDGIEHRWFAKRSLAGGGVLIDTAIHSIDIFRFLCGEITAATAMYTTNLDGVDLEVEHTATLGLRSVNHVIGTVDCSWKLPTGESVVRVFGTLGSLTYDYSSPGVITFRDTMGAESVIDCPTGNRWELEVRAFIQAVEMGTSVRTGTIDGLIGLHVLSTVYGANQASLVPGVPS